MVARSDVVLVALVVALFAAMPVANADCCSIESFMDIFSSCYAYHGSCGAFQTKSGCWSGGACYAMDEGSCCDTNGGAIAGLIIGLVVLVVGKSKSVSKVDFVHPVCSRCAWVERDRISHAIVVLVEGRNQWTVR